MFLVYIVVVTTSSKIANHLYLIVIQLGFKTVSLVTCWNFTKCCCCSDLLESPGRYCRLISVELLKYYDNIRTLTFCCNFGHFADKFAAVVVVLMVNDTGDR